MTKLIQGLVLVGCLALMPNSAGAQSSGGGAGVAFNMPLPTTEGEITPVSEIATSERLAQFAANAFTGAGALFMWAILLVSAFATTVGLEKLHFLFIRAGGGNGRLLDEICRLVKDNRIEEARTTADRSRSPFGRIARGVLRVRHGHSREEMQNVLDEAYLREIPIYHRRLPLLAVSANLSTLLGLLGTIAGLILAFEAVANVAAAQRTAALAGGISVAMATTGFGLLVAIPTLAIHGLLGARADRAVEEIESSLAILTGTLNEWNRVSPTDPYQPEKMGISGTERKIAEFVEAGGAK